MKIRSETPADYAAIAAVHAEAFAHRAIEAGIVALHRQRPEFDPELSLAAELDGAIVGHALFSPRAVRLLGREARAVNLAPIAISPAFQGRKIGTALINAGHELARAKGFELSFLLGHPWYYPKLGYLTHAYGQATVAVDAAGLPAGGLRERPPLASDVPALRALWEREEGGVDFAVDPGGALLDWLSPTAAVESKVFLSGEALVGYARIRRSDPSRPLAFLAASAAAAQAMAGMLAAQLPGGGLELPLHPASASAAAFGPPRCNAWEVSMARSLRPGPFDDYYAELLAGRRPPGRVTWPVEFEL